MLEFIDHEKIEAILFSADFNSIDHSYFFLLLSALDPVMSLYNGYEHLLTHRAREHSAGGVQ